MDRKSVHIRGIVHISGVSTIDGVHCMTNNKENVLGQRKKIVHYSEDVHYRGFPFPEFVKFQDSCHDSSNLFQVLKTVNM